MKYRIKVETRHRELFETLLQTIRDKTEELSVPLIPEEKRTNSSLTLTLDYPIDGRKNIKKIKDKDGVIDLDKVYPNRSKK